MCIRVFHKAKKEHFNFLFAVIAIAVLVTLSVFQPFGVRHAEAWFSTYKYRKLITFDRTLVPSTQNDFPVLVSFNDPDMKLDSDCTIGTPPIDGPCHAQGWDIVFTNTSDVQLNYDIESYTSDATNGTIVMWVLLPTLNGVGAASDTSIYMYYGKTGATDTQNPSAVWASGFVGVWHMKENPTGVEPTIKDSKGVLHGTEQGGMVSTDSVIGKIGNALNFAGGTNDYVVVGANPALDSANVMVSAWVKGSAQGSFMYAIGKGANACQAASYALETFQSNFGTTANMEFYISQDGSNQTKSTNPLVLDNTWRHLVGVFDDTNNLIQFYVNGAQVSSSATTNSINHTGTTNNNLGFGNYLGTCALLFVGQMDEIKISNVSRGAAWITAEFNNQTNQGYRPTQPTAFISALGVEESAPAGGYATSGTYTSNNITISPLRAWNVLKWGEDVSGACPTCDIKLQIQTAPDLAGAPNWAAGSQWCGPGGVCGASCGASGNWYTVPSGTRAPTLHNGHVWIRYCASFIGDGAQTPILNWVRINYQ